MRKEPYFDLDHYALRHGTDKSSSGHNYTKYYEFFFKNLREKPINLLEIGVWEGASLKMWEDYFPYGQIVGADIEDKSGIKFGERVSTIKIDQGSVADLSMLAISHDKYFDIIIDDGSHNGDHQILSFNVLFTALKKGGYYCIEDTLCSFDERWNTNGSVYDRIIKMVYETNVGGKVNRDWLNSNKEVQVDILRGLDYFEKHIEFVSVMMGLCVVKKI